MEKKKKTEPKRRRYPRVKAPILYRPIKALGPKRRISNISLGGLRVFMNERFRKGKRLEIELFLPDGQTLSVPTRVVWIKSLPEGSKASYDTGLEFTSLPRNAMKQLKTVLDTSSPE